MSTVTIENNNNNITNQNNNDNITNMNIESNNIQSPTMIKNTKLKSENSELKKKI